MHARTDVVSTDMSEDSAVDPSVESAEESGIDQLCSKVYKRLQAPLDRAIPIASHRKAVCTMLKARDALLRGATLDSQSRLMLVCSGVTCMRRATFEVDGDDQIPLLKKTATLIFSLLVMGEDTDGMDDELDASAAMASYGDYSDDDDEMGEEDMGESGSSTADKEAEEPTGDAPRKRRRLPTRDEQNMLACWKSRSLAQRIGLVGEPKASSWDTAMNSDAAVSRAALKEARYVRERNAMEEMEEFATIFFRSSSAAMTNSLIASTQPSSSSSRDLGSRSFLTLDTVGLLNTANEMQDDKLAALADAAESEAGQSILRDMILSFKLPTSALGVRRCVCLTRKTNAFATKNYPEILNGAHEAAMRGAMWSYQNDPDPVHKMSALLAGLALVIAGVGGDIRKGDAFSGRVLLPFIDCAPPAPHLTRIALLCESNEWVIYSTSSSGKPVVKFKKAGYDGFCECILLMSKSLV